MENDTDAPYTYHCVCTTLLLVLGHPFEDLPTRSVPAQDEAVIVVLSDPVSVATGHNYLAQLHNTTRDPAPIVIRREDGFEKRTLIRCRRCDLPIAYQLDQSSFAEPSRAQQVIYVLPGAVMSTTEMKSGKMPTQPKWAMQPG